MKRELPDGTVLRGNLGAYRIIRVLSDKGGFSITYLAAPVGKAGLVFTVKELYISDHSRRKDNGIAVDVDAAFERYREAFLNEARLLRNCSGHRGVVREIERFSANGTEYLVLEHISGRQLNEFTAGFYRSDPQRVRDIFIRLCEALHFIHNVHSLCHLDLKPNNVMIEEGSMRPVLIDFGSAAHFDDGGDKTLSEKLDTNSAGYTAPEIRNATIDIRRMKLHQCVRADVYSLGAVAFFVLTRHHPPVTASESEVDRLLADVDYAPEGLVEAVRRAMTVDSDRRLPDIAAFARLLGVELPPLKKDPESVNTERCDDDAEDIPTELNDSGDIPEDIPTDESSAPEILTEAAPAPAPVPDSAAPAPAARSPRKAGTDAPKTSNGPVVYVLAALVPVLVAVLVWSLFFREPAELTRPVPQRAAGSKTALAATAAEPVSGLVSPYPDAEPAAPTEAPQPEDSLLSPPDEASSEYRFPNGNIWYGSLYAGKPDGVGELHAFNPTQLGDSTLLPGWYIRNAVFEDGLFCSGDIYDADGNYRYTYIP